MFDLRKLFAREIRARKGEDIDPDSEYHPSDAPRQGLEVEYQTLIARQFRRWGIAPGCVTIEVRQLGRAPDGFEVFVAMVRLAKWERETAFRLLLGLPLLETKVRKSVRGTWLADFSHFGGLWLHASEQLHAMPGSGELRDVLTALVPPTGQASNSGTPERGASYSVTTQPPSNAGRSTIDPQGGPDSSR